MALTPAQLTNINIESTSAWLNSQADMASFKPQANTILAMLANQREGMTRNVIQQLSDNVKNNTVRVLWYDFCNKVAQDCEEGNTCNLEGDALNVLNEDYKITDCIRDSFSVNEQDYADTSLSVEKAIATGLRNSVKNILEKLNDKAIAILEASAIDGGTVSDSDIKGIVQLIKKAQLNGIENPFGIDGGTFFDAYFIAQAGANNADGKGDANIANMLRMYFDMLGFAKNGVEDNTYLMSPYSYALLTKNYATSTVPSYQADNETVQYKYQVPGTDLFVDVTVQNVCVDKPTNKYNIVVEVRLHYKIAINPAGCENENAEINKGIMVINRQAS